MTTQTWRAIYSTPKTDTYEFAFRTEHGIMSLKAMVIANGHKCNVFSGFEVLTGPAFDHRYVQNLYKSADKNKGDARVFDDREDPWKDIPMIAREAIDDALNGSGSVSEHWAMLNGFVPASDSAPKAKAKDGEKRVARENYQRERMDADDGWGVF